MSKEYLEIPLDAPGERECGVCYEKPRGLAEKHCECKELLCLECSKRIDKCPFCRKAFREDISNTLTTSEQSRAKRHWRLWFDRLDGFSITKEKLLQRIHWRLRTGNFKLRTEAGQCVDFQAARRYVERQLIVFQTTGGFNGHV